jgi:uncharacterized protein (TIGR02284 family)
MSMQTPNPMNPADPIHQTTNKGMASQCTNEDEVKMLNSLLKGELAACDTYAQALTKCDDHPDVMRILTNCRLSHESRCRKLSELILQLGGQPATTAGIWGAFVKFIEGGAKLFGDKAAIAALEEGEDKGLQDYRDALNKCSSQISQMIQFDMLPEQQRTHDALSALKNMT